MKIEKVNDNQIRCTLTREDLVSRELKISELAYGTEKAKNLFRDMMQQASYEFGFEAEDIPLMIEAIPLNSDCIVLIITKVEDPDELDTRFARFAPSVTDDDIDYDDFDDEPDDMKDFFKRLQSSAPEAPSDEDIVRDDGTDRTFVFRMDSLQSAMSAAALTASYFNGLSALYKDSKSGAYLLMLSQNGMPHNDFERICNTISEYGTIQRTLPAGRVFLTEHCETLIAADALKHLNGK
jgi:adapter protein MecA 1/2